MTKICLHIGFHKTASSFLQNNIFPNHPDVNYIGKFGRKEISIREGKSWKQMDALKMLNGLFNQEYSNLNQDIKIDKILSFEQNKLNVLSEERISSIFYYKEKNILKMFEKLKYLFDTENYLKILVFLRNQSDLLISRYSENPGLFSQINKNWKKFNRFVSCINDQKLTKYEKEILDNFKYHKFLKLLDKTFPKRNIGIFLYEDLKNDPDNFFHRLFDFLEIRNFTACNKLEYQSFSFKGFYENKQNYFSLTKIKEKKFRKMRLMFDKIPKFSHSIITKTLIIFLSFPNFLLQSIYNPIRKSKMSETNIKTYYMNDNDKLSELLKRDLKKLGY